MIVSAVYAGNDGMFSKSFLISAITVTLCSLWPTQNPGLGKFVWDEFQNGSSQSLARIMVAVFTIGIIGFLLDRVMYALQSMFTFSANR